MLIGEFAKRVGVSTDTVRFYEKVGFFSRARGDNGYRLYSEADVEVAELIVSGKAMGFSLREILGFLTDMSDGSLDHPKIQARLREKADLIDARIRSLRRVRAMVEKQIERCRAIEAEELARG